MTTAEDLGAILQRDRQSYAIVPRTPAGIVSPENLENIVKVARRYEIPVIKMTSGQRMALVGIKEEDIEKIWNELGMTVGKATAPCLHYVQTCPGTVAWWMIYSDLLYFLLYFHYIGLLVL